MSRLHPDVEVTTVGDAQVFGFDRADLTDAAVIKAVGDRIYDQLKGAPEPKVVIDFGKVQRLSSAALGMVVALKKVIVEKNGGQIRIANVADNLMDIFKMTRIDRVVKMHGSTAEAVEAMRS